MKVIGYAGNENMIVEISLDEMEKIGLPRAINLGGGKNISMESIGYAYDIPDNRQIAGEVLQLASRISKLVDKFENKE